MTTDDPTAMPRDDRASSLGLKYRWVLPTDMDFLTALYRSTREEEMAGLPWSEDQKQHFIEMQFRAQHHHYQSHYPDALWLVIESEALPIGRLYLERWQGELRVIDIALCPSARGRGYGEAILRDLQDEAAAAGRCIGIHVEKSNRAQSLYQRLGFVAVEDKGVYNLLRWTAPSA